MMIVTAWNNGDHSPSGAGYGFKIKIKDRDAFIHRNWSVVMLEIEGEPGEVEVNVAKASFWKDSCHELISAAIGRWLLKNGFAPWPTRNPPTFVFEPIDENRFRVRKPNL
jgi:hypothetical protein